MISFAWPCPASMPCWPRVFATIEIKSGYGLDDVTELNMLRAAREIQRSRAVRIKTTFLGAHAVPAEYKDRIDDYVDQVCIPTLERAHAEGLVDAVDGFCERFAFAPAQIARVFEKARELGLPVKLHAEQLSNLGGAKTGGSVWCTIGGSYRVCQ